MHFPIVLMGDQDHIFMVSLMYLSHTMIDELLPHLVLKQDTILYHKVKQGKRSLSPRGREK